jgi:hypothetical protein
MFIMSKRLSQLVAILACLSFAGTAVAQITGLEGDVKGLDGGPLAGAVIGIDRTDIAGHFQTKTNNNGHYLFMGLPVGTFRVTCIVDGRNVDAVEVATGPGPRARADFDLRAPAVAAQPQSESHGASGLGSLYVNAQDAAEQLHLNESDGSFSLVEGGANFSGTYSVNGNTLTLHIAELGKDVDIAINGRRLLVNGTEVWLQQSAVSCSAGAGPLVCSDKTYGVSFRLPEGWSVQSSWRWGDRESTVAFNDPRKIPEQAAPSLNYYPRAGSLPGTLEDVQETLRKAAENKVTQRRTEGLPTYRLRPDSCQPRTVGGHAARSCIAEFTGKSGTPMAEYLTFVRTANTGALFFGVIPVKGLDSYRSRFDAIIETLQIP